jgi:CheY-like chemotaxis protein/anti-sigma regulatory factor (Ser/Thr protein kinase)
VAIHVRTDVGDLPPIVGDAASLREMLASLLVNAVEAMPAGGTVTVQARAEADGVRLAVHDTGVGMSERVRERCLEPFFSTKEQHGAGLGLALVHATVERHGGTLTVESVAGQGSTFAVRLPLPRTPAAGSEPEPPAPARPLRILVVDDDPLARTAVTEQLGSEGHAVEAAAGGAEALERFTAGRFDMVITDRAMPGMGGDQLAITLRRLSPRTPIVMLTAFGELMDARGELPAGVDAVVSKPVTLSALARAIHRVTGG